MQFNSIFEFMNVIKKQDTIVMLDSADSMPLIHAAIKEGYEINTECDESLYTDLYTAEKNGTPFMVSFIENEIITEPYIPEREMSDTFLLLQDKYKDLVGISYSDIFSFNFDVFEMF